jgi:ADP-dependent NAD(P)H-hydrate dehydratase / NAD(P)H-hydrate epimerase
MKVLTAAEMREVDRRTIELGTSNETLMQNAGLRAVEFLADRFAPLTEQRIVVFCGKGNNGGDGLVVARELETRFHPRSLDIVRAEAADEITPAMRDATLIVDALLGTGLQGPARGRSLDLIREINSGFPLAKVVAVDIPSGMPSDSGQSEGEFARADATVTFTALKVAHVTPPNCDRMGEVRVADIGSPPALYKEAQLNSTEPSEFRYLFRPRPKESNKGLYGHVLVVGGAPGKSGAAEMSGLAALRAGAGLVTVACSTQNLRHPELMTEALPQSYDALVKTAAHKTVLAVGPGLGNDPNHVALVRRLAVEIEQAAVIDADGLNALAGHEWQAGNRLRVLTPHPGEMARLCGTSVTDVQKERLAASRWFSAKCGAVVVLKGNRTVIAIPDGRAWINPTGSPGMSSGGTGDILTGLIAGMLAQFPAAPVEAIIAAVYLHGLAGEIGAAKLTEQCLIATDLLIYLPEAIRACAALSH